MIINNDNIIIIINYNLINLYVKINFILCDK